jgi:peptidoglycan/xylan/chitin deacetylase (PgdA/CDA1 family)
MSVIAILSYHSVAPCPPDWIAPFAVAPAALARHLDFVVAGGHAVFTVAELARRLARDDVPTRSVAITFDDGFEDNLSIAAPLLRERALPATVFVTSGFLTARRPTAMLTGEQLVELEAAGVEVGAHGHTHRQLDVLPRAEARREIRLSKQLVESAVGHPIESFAYPHGYACAGVEAEVEAAGFRSACGVGNAFSHRQDNRWRLSRLTVAAATSDQRVQEWLRGTGARVAPAHEAPRTTAWRTARRLGVAGGRNMAPVVTVGARV